MQELEKLQEIEELGQEEAGEEKEYQERKFGFSTVPLIQAGLCVLLLLALLLLKFTQKEQYEKVTEWYRAQAAQEIEIPGFQWELPEKGDESSQAEKTPQEESDTPETPTAQRV